ncbi:unnamed protein product [Linum trigynum]|uniref:Neprosin PEP catalytic domain-containing protein n=1 Tax=Linum trigynum TaxID=586398 RepID=A0AAV2CWG4_9ROSI
MKFPHYRKFPSQNDNNITNEFGIAVYPRGTYYGATGNLNVWSPATFGLEFSLAQAWVTDGDGQDYNSVEAGWISDGYGSTGCYNLDCPGFVQTSQEVTLGEVLTPVSSYDGPQYQVTFAIHKDIGTGNWWLNFQGRTVGYWPRYIFSGLRTSASIIAWGGVIGNSHPQGSHTTTQMGSGHFANEGRDKAAFVDNLGFVDEGEHVKDAKTLLGYATNPACYSVQVGDWNNIEKTHFYYGGPGWSPNCK